MFFCSRERVRRRDLYLLLLWYILFLLASWPIYIITACKNILSPPSQAQNEVERDLVGRAEPLQRPRKGSLSLPLSPYIPQENSSAQIESPFFAKLPAEIRRLVYREVLAPPNSGVLHVASTYGALFSRRCYEREAGLRGWQHQCWGQIAFDGSTDFPKRIGNTKPPPEFTGLLRSCRRMYSEAIDILYTDNLFHFRQTRTIADLPRRILPHRLNLIRRLHLDCLTVVAAVGGVLCRSDYQALFDIVAFWDEAWALISRMEGLVDLRVSLSIPADRAASMKQDAVITLLTPLRDVRVAKFVVECYWRMDPKQVLEELGFEAPFTLETKEA